MPKQATLTSDDVALCVAALMMSARLASLKLDIVKAAAVQARVNLIAAGLHSGAISSDEADNICQSLSAMSELLRKDRQMPPIQRVKVLQQAAIVTQKLQRGDR